MDGEVIGERASRPITSNACGVTMIALKHDFPIAGRDACSPSFYPSNFAAMWLLSQKGLFCE